MRVPTTLTIDYDVKIKLLEYVEENKLNMSRFVEKLIVEKIQEDDKNGSD